MRRALYLWSILFAAGVSMLAAADAQGAAKNVVLIVADDLGRQLGCYGDRVVKTPNIDRLAAAGTRFTRAHCTTASCSPSRSVILSGLHNHATGQYGLEHATHHFRSHENLATLPTMLAGGGYRMCSIGKFHVGPEKAYHFETYANDGIQGARNGVRMAANAKQFIAAKDDRPFFLYFCTSDPHRSGAGGQFGNPSASPSTRTGADSKAGAASKSNAAKSDAAKSNAAKSNAAKSNAADTGAVAPGGARYPGIDPVRYDPKDVELPKWLPDQPEVRREWAEYLQSISRADQGIGALLDALKETGHWDDTLVIFLSDNGPPFPGAKTTLYESGTHLPLVIRNPSSSKHGGTTDALASWVDIAPTILEYSGVTHAKERFHGRSLLAVLDQPHPAGWDEIYFSHSFHEVTMYYPMRAIRVGDFKYILNLAHQLPYPFASDLYESHTWQGVLSRQDTMLGHRPVSAFVHRPRHELYDLSKDPDELRNLADDPNHAQTLASLQEKLKAWQKRTSDPWLVKYRYE